MCSKIKAKIGLNFIMKFNFMPLHNLSQIIKKSQFLGPWLVPDPWLSKVLKHYDSQRQFHFFEDVSHCQ